MRCTSLIDAPFMCLLSGLFMVHPRRVCTFLTHNLANRATWLVMTAPAVTDGEGSRPLL